MRTQSGERPGLDLLKCIEPLEVPQWWHCQPLGMRPGNRWYTGSLLHPRNGNESHCAAQRLTGGTETGCRLPCCRRGGKLRLLCDFIADQRNREAPLMCETSYLDCCLSGNCYSKLPWIKWFKNIHLFVTVRESRSPRLRHSCWWVLMRISSMLLDCRLLTTLCILPQW